MQKTSNLQSEFLNCARKERVQVTVFLTNGFQMRGTVKAYDDYTVVIESERRQQLIYKHAISTIVPTVSVEGMRADFPREVKQVE